MPNCLHRSYSCAIALALLFTGSALQAQSGAYTEAQADRGKAFYQAKCAACHGASLGGGLAPALTGSGFDAVWGGRPLAELAGKISGTMPPEGATKTTPQQAADVVAHLLRLAKLPSGTKELPADEKALSGINIPGKRAVAGAARTAPLLPPNGNLAQVMRGILFPSSNMIFNVQTTDPAAPITAGAAGPGATQSFSWVGWGAGLYKGGALVVYAAIAVADSAPLMLTPGRRCENGRPVPVDRPDWVKFTLEMAEAGRAAYKASQSRSQDAVSEASGQLSDSCLHCHEVYRDMPGGTSDDPSNKASRCVP